MKDPKVRLYVDHPLGQGQCIALTAEQSNYLFAVMRLGPGAGVRAFNGHDGEWTATVARADKRKGALTVGTSSAPQVSPPDIWLLFAPLKKTQTDFVVEKAVELGVARLQPILTDFTNAERVRTERLQARATEAAEQCGATFVPDVAEAVKLATLLSAWPEPRGLIFCDEGQSGHRAEMPDLPPPAAILIGPEGGFSQAERTRIAALPQSRPISLGPRILRAETAAIAALTLWQACNGDW